MECVFESAAEAYPELLYKIQILGQKENTRNGEVLAFPGPVMVTIQNPLDRLINDPHRLCNPYFHCMEFIWMMSGSSESYWITKFNKGLAQYAEDNGTFYGAYGHRWRYAFSFSQIPKIIKELTDNPQSRRVVLQMWEPWRDLENGAGKKDLPCNTQIMFRTSGTKLNMTVLNRSNDLVWGMMGANVVHMTMLQELIAESAGLDIGSYTVVSNNLHLYLNMPRFDEILKSSGIVRKSLPCEPMHELYANFSSDSEEMMQNEPHIGLGWFSRVAIPMYKAYLNKEKREHYNGEILDTGWKSACEYWTEQKRVG